MELNEAFKKLRKDNKMTQDQFAEKLGINQSYISNVESGRFNISFESLQKYYKMFGKEIKIKL